MPRVMNYEIDPEGVHRKIHDQQEFQHKEPGFTMSIDSVGSLTESSS